jgi:hypothetical protein
MTKKPAKTPAASAVPVKTREQLMDAAARKTFEAMDRVNNDKSLEYKIMNERDINPLAPRPSDRNAASEAVDLSDLTFSQAGETRFGNSPFMWARRRF